MSVRIGDGAAPRFAFLPATHAVANSPTGSASDIAPIPAPKTASASDITPIPGPKISTRDTFPPTFNPPAPEADDPPAIQPNVARPIPDKAVQELAEPKAADEPMPQEQPEELPPDLVPSQSPPIVAYPPVTPVVVSLARPVVSVVKPFAVPVPVKASRPVAKPANSPLPIKMALTGRVAHAVPNMPVLHPRGLHAPSYYPMMPMHYTPYHAYSMQHTALMAYMAYYRRR